MGSALNAIHDVLKEAGEPLHYKEITRRIIDGGLWQTEGQTPEASINAQLTIHIIDTIYLKDHKHFVDSSVASGLRCIVFLADNSIMIPSQRHKSFTAG